MILLVASTKDPASINIAKQFLQIYPFTKTVQVYQDNPVYTADIGGKQVTHIMLKEEAVYAQYLAEDFSDAKMIIFISRHSSQSGTPTLSVHTPGNFAAARLGGLPCEVSISPAKAMQAALQTMNRLTQQMQLAYHVSYECTHHGPSLKVPTMFTELGSSLKQWSDKKAATVVAHAALAAITSLGCSHQETVIGIGGTHYNQKFTRMALRNEASFGHMIPKYAVPLVDANILQQCISRTQEKVTAVVLDWKGIKSDDKPELLKMIQKVGLPVRKV